MTYKIIVSVICIVFVVALIGSNLKKQPTIEDFETMEVIEDEPNVIIVNGEKICYIEGSKHTISDLEIDGTAINTIESNPLSLLYLSNKHYDLTNLYMTAIFKVNNIKNNPKLFKCDNFDISIINADKPCVQINTNKGTQTIDDLEIKENEYYTYSLGITPTIISFIIKDDPDTEKEHIIYQDIDNQPLERIFLGDNFTGNTCIKPKIFRNQIKEDFIIEDKNIQKEDDILKISMEKMFNDNIRIHWKHNEIDESAYYVVIMHNIDNNDMILNLAIPLIYKDNYYHDIKHSELKFNQTIVIVRKYIKKYNYGILSKPSNKLIINK
jgi:hypothetical protein